MDYEAHYNRLILRARDRTLTGYVERHHVLPRCMGGGDEPGNIVALTAEEHYVAHQLLVRIYPVSHGLAWAAVNMAHRSGNNKAYGWLRRKLALFVSARNSGNTYSVGRKYSAEQRAKNAAAQRGKKLTVRHCANISAALKGRRMSPESIAKSAAAQRGTKRRPHTLEARRKIGAASRGNTYALGKKHGPRTDEHRMRLSKSHLGKRHSPETRAKISAIQIGKKLSPEHKANIAAGLKGFKRPLGRKLSPQHRAAIMAAHQRPEVKAKVRLSKLGLTPWNKGLRMKEIVNVARRI